LDSLMEQDIIDRETVPLHDDDPAFNPITVTRVTLDRDLLPDHEFRRLG
jgi:hypothetical protein